MRSAIGHDFPQVRIGPNYAAQHTGAPTFPGHLQTGNPPQPVVATFCSCSRSQEKSLGTVEFEELCVSRQAQEHACFQAPEALRSSGERNDCGNDSSFGRSSTLRLPRKPRPFLKSGSPRTFRRPFPHQRRLISRSVSSADSIGSAPEAFCLTLLSTGKLGARRPARCSSVRLQRCQSAARISTSLSSVLVPSPVW